MNALTTMNAMVMFITAMKAKNVRIPSDLTIACAKKVFLGIQTKHQIIFRVSDVQETDFKLLKIEKTNIFSISFLKTLDFLLEL